MTVTERVRRIAADLFGQAIQLVEQKIQTAPG